MDALTFSCNLVESLLLLWHSCIEWNNIDDVKIWRHTSSVNYFLISFAKDKKKTRIWHIDFTIMLYLCFCSSVQKYVPKLTIYNKEVLEQYGAFRIAFLIHSSYVSISYERYYYNAYFWYFTLCLNQKC